MLEQRLFKYSLSYWRLASTEWKRGIDRICETAKKLGILSLELVPSELLRDVRQQGLGMALANNGMPDPPFQKGLNNLRYQDEVIERTKEAIDECVEFGIPNVIAFTGYKLTNAAERRNLSRGGRCELRCRTESFGSIRWGKRCDNLSRAPEHARQLASDEGTSWPSGRRPWPAILDGASSTVTRRSIIPAFCALFRLPA